MSDLNLLLVEDSQSDIDIIQNAVTDFNDENDDGINVLLHISKDLSGANQILDSVQIDAAIVDLKLQDHGSPQGVDLVQQILENITVLTIVFSGTTGYTEHLREQTSSFFKLYTKGEVSADDIIKEIVKLYKTGITQILSSGKLQEEFKKLLVKVFWDHISNSIDYWIQNNDQKSLYRYIQSHILEHYKFDSSGNLDEYSPAEIYITPPINECEHTGDVFIINDEQWLVLSPACDMVVQPNQELRRAEFITMVKMLPMNNIVADNVQRPLSNNQRKVVKKKLRELRYFSLPLPKFGEIYSSYIDFQSILSFPQNELRNTNIKRLGTISEPFIKDIVFQFSSYYSRQGAPSINEDKLYRLV